MAELAATRSQAPAGSSRLYGAQVLVVTTHYAPETAGPAPYTTDLAEHLSALGARVRVVTTHPHFPQWRRPAGESNRSTRELRAGVQVVRVPTYVPRTPTMLRRSLYEASFLVSALPAASAFRPDVVVACTPSVLAGRLGVEIARRRGVPCVTVVQSLATSPSGRRLAGLPTLIESLASFVERGTMRRSSRVTVPSEALAPVVRALAPNAFVDVVANWTRGGAGRQTAGGVTEEAAATAERATARRAMRRQMGWGGRFVIAHIGPIGAKQGLEDLAGPLRHLTAAVPEVLVSFIGQGNRRAALLDATADLRGVEMRDPVPSDDYQRLLQAADVLLVHERGAVKDLSLPSTLSCYFTAGRPVLAVVREDSAVALEVARSGAGVLVAPNDPTGFTTAVQLLKADGAQRDRLAAAGRAYAAEHLAPAAALRHLTGLIEAALSPYPGSDDAPAAHHPTRKADA